MFWTPSGNLPDTFFTHYQEAQGVPFTAVLDNYFWNETFTDKVVDAGVIHLVENSSDHCPICSTILLNDVKHQHNPTDRKLSKFGSMVGIFVAPKIPKVS